MCKNKGIQVHFKGSNTLRPALGNPKDKDPKANQTGIIYHYQCLHTNCSSTYIGESGRTLGDRIKKHFKAPSPIHQHSSTTGHPMDSNQFNIIHKEVNSQPRTIKEAMFIHMQDPPLNRNLGKYQLPHIWDHLLQASTTLHCKQTNYQPTSHPTNPPYWSPCIILLSHSPPTYTIVGSTPFSFFLMVSTHVWPKYHPLLIYNKSYPSTILVSSFKYFVSLIFLSDLMKQLQYGCQQKLVNDFKMILLCFSISSFIRHPMMMITAENTMTSLPLSRINAAPSHSHPEQS